MDRPLQLTDELRKSIEEFSSQHKTGVLVLLFTDIVGSTALKQDFGDTAGAAVIRQHNDIVREVLETFAEGEEISTAGDSFFLTFVRPSDAVRFSILLHSRLREAEGRFPRPVAVRIGIHMGEVHILDDPGGPGGKDLLGTQVDIAARIMSLADGGQTLMSRGVFDNASSIMKAGVLSDTKGITSVNHGFYRLKGVSEPFEIAEIGEEGLAPSPAPEDSEKAKRVSRILDGGPSEDRLSSLALGEYGSEEYLERAPLLLFGILTFWIYTIHVLTRRLRTHYAGRKSFLQDALVARDSGPDERAIIDECFSSGFLLGRRHAVMSIVLNVAVLVGLVCGAGGEQLGILSAFQDACVISVCGLVFFLSVSSFAFTLYRSLRKHEYSELLLMQSLSEDRPIKRYSPSAQLSEKWNRDYGDLLLFLVICVVIFVLPGVAAFHVAALYESKFSFGLGLNGWIAIWTAATFGVGGLFHLWGISLLVRIFNGHLRYEKETLDMLEGRR